MSEMGDTVSPGGENEPSKEDTVAEDGATPIDNTKSNAEEEQGTAEERAQKRAVDEGTASDATAKKKKRKEKVVIEKEQEMDFAPTITIKEESISGDERTNVTNGEENENVTNGSRDHEMTKVQRLAHRLNRIRLAQTKRLLRNALSKLRKNPTLSSEIEECRQELEKAKEELIDKDDELMEANEKNAQMKQLMEDLKSKLGYVQKEVVEDSLALLKLRTENGRLVEEKKLLDLERQKNEHMNAKLSSELKECRHQLEKTKGELGYVQKEVVEASLDLENLRSKNERLVEENSSTKKLLDLERQKNEHMMRLPAQGGRQPAPSPTVIDVSSDEGSRSPSPVDGVDDQNWRHPDPAMHDMMIAVLLGRVRPRFAGDEPAPESLLVQLPHFASRISGKHSQLLTKELGYPRFVCPSCGGTLATGQTFLAHVASEKHVSMLKMPLYTSDVEYFLGRAKAHATTWL